MLRIFLVVLLSRVLTSFVFAENQDDSIRMCRSHSGKHRTVESFQLHSYAWCYKFLFHVTLSPEVSLLENKPVIILQLRGQKVKVLHSMDYKNQTAKDDVCSTLSFDECHRWTSCCSAADNCCRRQLSLPPEDNSTCGRIWDGWQCWDDGLPGTLNYASCPLFIPYSIPSRQAVKSCQENGQWTQKTDFAPCVNYQSMETSLFIGLGCSITSIVFLFPAILIFLRYKTLRKQHRIRLHVNFFLALLVQQMMTILWDMLVTYDKVKSTSVFDTTLVENGVGCKVLAFLKIYLNCCCYTWMFCEGFYLHRLMSNAFSPPRSLIYMYIGGWTIPLVSSTVYGILRGVYSNESCWAFPYGNFEWIFDAPNMACLVLNLVFLANILRILLTQMQTHPNEPSNFRRAVKATFILIPLFGIQLFVTLYRIPISDKGGLEYERLRIVVNHTQGFCVAMVFCFLNGEVLSNLRRTWRRQVRDRSFSASRRLNHTTNQSLSMRSEYDVTKNGDNCNIALLDTGKLTTLEAIEMEVKDKQNDGNSLINGKPVVFVDT